MSARITQPNTAFTEALSIILRFEERGQTSAARMLLLADIQKVIEERNMYENECDAHYQDDYY